MDLRDSLEESYNANPDLIGMMDVIKGAVCTVGEWVRNATLSQDDVIEKDGTPLTAVDIDAGKMLEDILRATNFDLSFINEDGTQDTHRRALCRALIDPLDNTKDFEQYHKGEIDAYRHSAVMVAVQYKRRKKNRDDPNEKRRYRTIMSAMFNPWTEELFSASYGNGAYRFKDGVEEQVYVNKNTEYIDLLVSKSRPSDQLNNFKGVLCPRFVKGMGGAYKILEVGVGNSNLYLLPEEQPIGVWDKSAPGLFLKEAGGKITDLAGMEVDYDTGPFEHNRGLVVSNGEPLHSEVVRKLWRYHSVRPYVVESASTLEIASITKISGQN